MKKKKIIIYLCFIGSFATYIYRATNGQFGKTHFIVGQKHLPSPLVTVKHDQETNNNSTVDESCITQAFFTSRHDIRSIIMSMLQKARRSISVAAFALTDKNIVNYLKKAHNNGIVVAVVTDQSTMQERHSKIKMLTEAHVPVFRYNPLLNNNPRQKKTRYMPLMHHKFIIIDEEIVITGSSNLTHAGQIHNMENIVIIRDKKTVADYMKEFELLTGTCIAC